jgi:hypothetical protein
VKVSLSGAYKIRRIYRRLAKMRGRGNLRRLTVFVRHKNVLKLLGSWGIVRRSSRGRGVGGALYPGVAPL